MSVPDSDRATGALVDDAGTSGRVAAAPPHPSSLSIPAKSKKQNIHVSPAVLDAAQKDTEQLLHDLRTSLEGLSQADAEVTCPP